MYSCFTLCGWTLSAGFLFFLMTETDIQSYPVTQTEITRATYFAPTPDAESSTSTPHGTCCGASALPFTTFIKPRLGLMREFMSSDKRCGENTRQPVCEAAVCDSFPHFIHMLWLIQLLGCKPQGLDFSNRCVGAFNVTYVAGVKLTASLSQTETFVFVKRCPPDMYRLNRSVQNLILSLELHPISMSYREPGIDSFFPLKEPHDVLRLAALLQALREYPQRPRLLGFPSALKWASLAFDLKPASQINVFAQKRLIPPQSGNTNTGFFIWKTRQIKSPFPPLTASVLSLIVSFTDFKEA